jgi:hypothetical protein
MYRVFVTACAVGALLSLCVGAAFGQAGTIGIFADNAGTNPYISDTQPGLLTVYVVHVATDGAAACEYAAPQPACFPATYLSDTNVFPVTIGNSQTGVSIGYGSCRVGTVLVQKIDFFATGTTPPCCPYDVTCDPLSGTDACALGKVDIVDCHQAPAYAEGGSAVINHEGCDCPQPTLVLNGYESVYWQDPLWSVRVRMQNNGPGVAEQVSATMHEDIPWLTIPDPTCNYGQLSPGNTTSGVPDFYTYDLTNHPGGSFNVWFDVSYYDRCGELHHLRLDPEFEPENDLAPVTAASASWGLGQNYPNPFNPTTTIPFVLAEETDVRLSVFDARGQLVQVLVNRSLPAGANGAVWNGRDSKGNPVASGVYFCRLETPGTAQTRKLMLLK